MANREVLDIYLRRRVAPGDVPAREVEDVFAAFEDPERLDSLLSGFDADQLERTLIRLQGYERDYPGVRPEVTIEVLTRHGQRLPRKHRHMGDVGAPMELARVIYRLLRNLEPDRVAATVEAAHFPDFSSRYEVIRMVGHREGSGHRLVEPERATRYERQLIEDLLSASAAAVAEESDLRGLLALGFSLRETDVLAAIARWAADDSFLARLVGAHLRVSLSNTLGQVAVRRSTQLDWPALVAKVGQERLIQRIGEIDRAWMHGNFDDDIVDAWEQAVRYAADPAAGDADAARWLNRSDDDDDD